MINNRFELPDLGLGLGLRSSHFQHILEHQPKVDWFEVISENFMDSGGRPRQILNQISSKYPVVMHGVSLSIGSVDPLNYDYLKNLKSLAEQVKPVWVSDHLCWTGVLNVNSHDLLPLPLNEESLDHVVERIKRVQDYLDRPLILENPSTYMSLKGSNIPEWEFLARMAEEADCGLLLDVNNVFVSSFNNDFDPLEYLRNIPYDRVVQLHLAGHQHCGDYIIDTHDRNVAEYVWELFRFVWQRSGGKTTLLEWDGAIPDFNLYHDELMKAKQYMEGGFDPNAVTPQKADQREVISTPVNHMIPKI